MRLKSLTYTSRGRLDLTDADINDIFQTARHLNALDGITGLLIYDGLRFLQIVEGSEEAIDALVERLHADPRHAHIEIRDERFIEARCFPEWSMELLQVDAGYATATDEISAILPEQTTPPVRQLILGMAEKMVIHA